jgi:hypothetical protein
MRRIYIQIAIVIAMALPAKGEYHWNSVAPMQLPRMGHCAAASRGRIYVFGGISMRRHMEPVASVEIFLPDSNRWISGASLPIPLYQASAVAIGRYIFVLGGLNQNSINDVIFAYDTQHDQIHAVGRLPVPRRAMGAVGVGSRVLIMAGIEGRQQIMGTGFWWEPDSDRWVEAHPLNQPCAGFGLVSNESVYAVGGMFLGPLSRIEQLIGDRWVELLHSDLPEPRGEIGTAFLNDTLIVVAGGVGPHGASSDAFGFTPRGHTWHRLPPMSSPRIDFPLVELDGRLYAIGGNARDNEPMEGILGTVEVFEDVNAVHTDDTQRVLPNESIMPIWPNPTNGTVSIGLPITGFRLSIFDLAGRRVAVEEVAGTKIWVWQTSAVPAGNYLAKLSNDKGKELSTGRVVIAK